MKNRFAADMVSTVFNSCAIHQVHIPTEFPAQLFLHARHIEKGVPGLRMKLDQHIHVAVGAAVLTHNGTKKSQFRDLPATTEAVYSGTGNVDVGAHSTGFRLLCNPQCVSLKIFCIDVGNEHISAKKSSKMWLFNVNAS